MNELIAKLKNENKINEESAFFIESIYLTLTEEYDYLGIKEETWVSLFNNVINKQENFQIEKVSYIIESHLNNFIKKKLTNHDTIILNNYLLKLMKNTNNYSLILKKLYSFIARYKINLDDDYFNILKSNSPRFNIILESLGISDFDNNLVKYYNQGYFDLIKLLRTKNLSLTEVLTKYLDILNYKKVSFNIDINNPNLILEISKTDQFKQIKLIISNYDTIKNIYQECKTIASDLTMSAFKSSLYNYSYDTLNQIIFQYNKYSNFKSNFLYNKLLKDIIFNIDKNYISSNKDVLDMLSELLIQPSDNYSISKKLINNLYNSESKMNQCLLQLNIYNHNVGTLSHDILKRFTYIYNLTFMNAILNEGNIYKYILNKEENNPHKRKLIDLLLSVESANTKNNINLYFSNNISNQIKYFIFSKIKSLQKKYLSMVSLNNPLNNIYDYVLNDKRNILSEKLKVDYVLSNLPSLEINIINDFFNNNLPLEEYKSMYQLLINIKREYKKWYNIFKNTNNDLLNEIHKYLTKEDIANTSDNIYPEIELYFQDKIDNDILRKIISCELSNYYDLYLSKIKFNSVIIDYISQELNIKRDIVELLVSILSKKDFKFLGDYFTKNEYSLVANNILNYLLNNYNYYILNNKLPNDYYLIKILQEIDFKKDKLEVLA